VSVTAACSKINKAPIREGIEKLSWGLIVNPNYLKRHTDTLTITIRAVFETDGPNYTTFQTKLTATNLKKTP
jgi:hypothetical protein